MQSLLTAYNIYHDFLRRIPRINKLLKHVPKIKLGSGAATLITEGLFLGVVSSNAKMQSLKSLSPPPSKSSHAII